MEVAENQAPQEDISLAADLSKAWDEIESREADKAPIKEEVKAQEVAEKVAEVTETPEAVAVAEEKPEEVKAAAELPLSWGKSVKEKWATLPPEVQTEISKREKEIERGFTKMDEERNLGKSMKDIITPYMPMIQAEGGTPQAAVRDLLNTAYVLRQGTAQQKAQLLHQVARQYGVDLMQVSPAQGNTDPALSSLQQQLNQVQQTLQQERAFKQQQEEGALQAQIQAFASDPSHLHFESVKGHMSSLLKDGHAKDLEDAYQQAIYANPQTRSTMLESLKVSSGGQRVADKQAKAEAAKKAATSVRGGPGAGAALAAPNASLRDELSANFDAILNR